MQNFDFLIIGTGAGNIVLDAALDAGLKCAVVEKGHFGGTCLNRGCIPSKVLITPADYIHEVEHLKRCGILKGELKIDWPSLKEAVFAKTAEHRDILEEYLAESNLTVFQGTAEFKDNHTIIVNKNDGEKEEVAADTIVIAAGARTNVPPIDGLDQVEYLTTETFFADKFPDRPYKSLTIVGGGVIAVEFAHLFATYGTEVNIVQRNVALVPRMDREISNSLYKSYTANPNISVFLNQNTLSASQDESGITLKIQDKKSCEEREITAEALLIAPGVISNGDSLHLERTDLTYDKRNYIYTNEYLETAVPNIYALGDIVGHQQLRHKANHEAEVLAHNLFGAGSEKGQARRQVNYEIMPAGVFSYPQLASVGASEEELKERGVDYRVDKFYFADTAKGYAMGYRSEEYDDFVKVLAAKNSGEIYGVHIVGPNATVLIQPYVNVMNLAKTSQPRYHEEIASDRTQYERQENFQALDIDACAAIADAPVIHPAASEVAIWACEKL